MGYGGNSVAVIMGVFIMLVKATRFGFYNNSRKREGDTFEIEGSTCLGTWMEVIEEPPAPAPPDDLPDEILALKVKADELSAQAAAARDALKQNTPRHVREQTNKLIQEAQDALEAYEFAFSNHYVD